MKRFKRVAWAALLASVLLVSACSSNSNDTAPANNNEAGSQNNGSTPADNAGTNNQSGNNGNNAASNGSDVTGGNASGDNGASNSGSSDNGGTNSSSGGGKVDDATAKELQAMLASAKEGKIEGIPFAADTGMIDDVEKAWGKSDHTESAGAGLYATYAKHDAVIGFNKGDQIFDVRSDADALHKLTLAQMEGALGKADRVTTNGGDSIYAYAAGKSFELRFIIPADTGKVDHISVYAPADAVNNMAG